MNKKYLTQVKIVDNQSKHQKGFLSSSYRHFLCTICLFDLLIFSFHLTNVCIPLTNNYKK